MTTKELHVSVNDGKYVIKRVAGSSTATIVLRDKGLIHIAFETENPHIEKVVTALAEELQEARDVLARPQSPPVFYKYHNVVYDPIHQSLAQMISDQGDEWEFVATSDVSANIGVVVFRARVPL